VSLGKKKIINNISSKAQISIEESLSILDSFLLYIKNNKNKKIKISNFGTFSPHVSPCRIGRNPLTKKEYQIKSMKKIKFNSSKKIKSILN
jgi:integration host factor subunit alpha